MPVNLDDLYTDLQGLSKALEGSGRIDEHDHPQAYAVILDAMTVVRNLQLKDQPRSTKETK